MIENIIITDSEMTEYLEDNGIEVTEEILADFRMWLDGDIHEWLKSNARSFLECYKEKN